MMTEKRQTHGAGTLSGLCFSGQMCLVIVLLTVMCCTSVLVPRVEARKPSDNTPIVDTTISVGDALRQLAATVQTCVECRGRYYRLDFTDTGVTFAYGPKLWQDPYNKMHYLHEPKHRGGKKWCLEQAWHGKMPCWFGMDAQADAERFVAAL